MNIGFADECRFPNNSCDHAAVQWDFQGARHRQMQWNEGREEKAAQPLFKQGMVATQDRRMNTQLKIPFLVSE